MKEKTLLKIKIILCAVTSLVLLSSFFYFGFTYGIQKKSKIVHVDFETVENTEIENWKYSFLKKEYSNYIESLSSELKIDSDLVVAILIKENPEFNPDAIHQNVNGTFDCGLMQLNDKYIYTVFVPAYWDLKNIEFNPFNWKHNLFLAMHHIQYLCESLKVQDDVIAAYNAGRGAVISGKIPESTRYYVASVKNNLKLLKMECNNDDRA